LTGSDPDLFVGPLGCREARNLKDDAGRVKPEDPFSAPAFWLGNAFRSDSKLIVFLMQNHAADE
jgi:hypothetical protein